MTAIENASYIQQGLQAATTSYYGVGGDAALVQSVFINWDAAFVGTYTFWTTGLFNKDAATNDAGATTWVQQNPASGYTPISPAGAATAATPLVISVPGGTAGCTEVYLGNFGSRRLRVRCVCTVAGVTTIAANGKY